MRGHVEMGMMRRAFGLPRRRAKRVALLALAGTFVVAGAAHFVRPAVYESVMPPYLPAPRTLVYLSGLFEVLGGFGVLPRATRSASGWGLVALLVAVFPANLHMALHPEPFVERGIPLWALYTRLPLQAALIAWAYGATRPESDVRSGAA